jgi:hypothetical protein
MKKLQIYVCGHNDDLNLVPNFSYLKKVNLNDLDIGKYQNNQLSESRIFLSQLIEEPVQYIGFLSYRYQQKCPECPSFKDLESLDLSPNIVYCANIPQLDSTPLLSCGWVKSWYSGIDYIWDDMIQFLGLPERISFMTNNFICSWEIFQKFILIWKNCFEYLYEKYPVMDFLLPIDFDNNRKKGYIFEILTSIIFSDLINKNNLKLLKMTSQKRQFKKILLKKSYG